MKKQTKKTAKSVNKKVSRKTEEVVIGDSVSSSLKETTKQIETTLSKPVMPQKTEAEKIWEEIKDKPIEMFALPNQFVFQHCTPVLVEPGRLYVLIRSTATLPSLEVAIGNNFTVELADKFVIVARAKKV